MLMQQPCQYPAQCLALQKISKSFLAQPLCGSISAGTDVMVWLLKICVLAHGFSLAENDVGFTTDV